MPSATGHTAINQVHSLPENARPSATDYAIIDQIHLHTKCRQVPTIPSAMGIQL
jgi:hypothetical protein